jgi:hypothetical protein
MPQFREDHPRNPILARSDQQKGSDLPARQGIPRATPGHLSRVLGTPSYPPTRSTRDQASLLKIVNFRGSRSTAPGVVLGRYGIRVFVTRRYARTRHF